MTLDRKWEKFRGGPANAFGQSLEPRVTINFRGKIFLNRKMYELFGSPKAVALFYSREDDQIAVQPAYDRFAEHFPVRRLPGNGFGIHASTFCRHYNIRVPTTERFIRPELTAEGQLILNLRETVTVGGIVRKRKARET
ncbi:MAG: hypothetical protein IT173_10155 [Acidobacteria bacterium]|nr:hypothetical protein [Acidobacteriota bacterium]